MDIYITIDSLKNADILEQYAESYDLKIKKILRTPNKGRDIGPLLTEIGKELDKEYEIYGHIHTKKSVHLKPLNQCWRSFLISICLVRKAIKWQIPLSMQ